MKNLIACLSLLLLLSCKKSTDDVPSKTDPKSEIKADSTSLALSGITNAIDSFTVQYSGKWHITTTPSPATWLKLSDITGTGNKKIYVTMLESDTSGMTRTATLNITPEESGVPGTHITITQNPIHFNFSALWGQSFGGTSMDEFELLVKTPDGGYIAVGNTQSSDGDVLGGGYHGYPDVLIAKFDANGAKVWVKVLGGSQSEKATSIVRTTDGNYVVTAQTMSTDGDVAGNHGIMDAWIIKLDENGNILWKKTYGGSDWEYAWSVTASADGGCVVAGMSASHDGDVSGVHGKEDAWIFKLDASGTLAWQRTYGGSEEDQAKSISATPDGGYLVAGLTFSTDGDVTTSYGGGDAWVLKLNSDGTLAWKHSYGGAGWEYLNTIARSPDGTYLLAGETASTDGAFSVNHGIGDGWMIKIDGTGTLLWQKVLGGSMEDGFKSAFAGTDGTFVLGGQTSSHDGDITGGYPNGTSINDAWLMKLDASGNTLWSKLVGGTDSEIASAVVALDNNTYVMAGGTASNDGDITSHHGLVGWEDAWLFKFTDQ